jgi:hypothetical protein
VCPSFLVGNQDSVIQAGLIHGLTYPPESIEAALATLALVKKVPHCLFDQFIAAPVPAAGEFLLDLLFQIGG